MFGTRGVTTPPPQTRNAGDGAKSQGGPLLKYTNDKNTKTTNTLYKRRRRDGGPYGVFAGDRIDWLYAHYNQSHL